MQNKFKEANQPHIISAYQRDSEYRSWLRFAVLESLEILLPYRLIHSSRAEWTIFADLVYFALTTGRGKQTLGEQYCNIEPVSRKNGLFPSVARRWNYFVLSCIGPYAIHKLVQRW